MTIGVGGATEEKALQALSSMVRDVMPIQPTEYRLRIAKAQQRMRELGIAAIYANAGSNMTYFSGTRWHPSERMCGIIIPASGEFEYIAPAFEEGTVRDYMVIEGRINCWQEHESPYQLFIDTLQRMGIRPNEATTPRIGICESAAFFIYDGIRKLADGYDLINAQEVSGFCRVTKSATEIAIMQRAHHMTLAVHQAAASILHEGISTTEVEAFIDRAHRKVGATGSYFCIVLFGEATAFPHGVKHAQILKPNDVVLIDTGCLVHGYMSDITRTYVYGTPTERQRQVWNMEKAAQAAAFAAAQLGIACEEVDRAARRIVEAEGFGPGYKLPGIPHRTGHGIGLDIHEAPYIVAKNQTPLAPGMCFSNEPMICVPGEFGIRHEDHVYMTEHGPQWFTEPAYSIDDPFGLKR